MRRRPALRSAQLPVEYTALDKHFHSRDLEPFWLFPEGTSSADPKSNTFGATRPTDRFAGTGITGP